MIFISYSRSDAEIVLPLVKFLRAAGQVVFLDTDDLPYGNDWKAKVGEAVGQAARCLIFWSKASSASDQVREEISLALKHPTCSIVPILLDDTPLPATIARYHGADELAPLVARIARARKIHRLLRVIVIGVAIGLAINQFILLSGGPEEWIAALVIVGMAVAFWAMLSMLPATYRLFVVRPAYKRLAQQLSD